MFRDLFRVGAGVSTMGLSELYDWDGDERRVAAPTTVVHYCNTRVSIAGTTLICDCPCRAECMKIGNNCLQLRGLYKKHAQKWCPTCNDAKDTE